MKRERDNFGEQSRFDAAHYQALLEEEILIQRARRDARRLIDTEERPPVELPPPMTLRERLAQPVNPVAWRVEGWLPAGGRATFVAGAKAGKTTTLVSLVRSLVDSVPWLDRDQVTPVTGRVAVIDFEMGDEQLASWYRRAGIVNDDRVDWIPMRGRGAMFDLRDAELRAMWAKRFVEADVEVVIWDCLAPVMNALGLNEHNDAGLLLTGFDALLAEANSPDALVVHHMGWSGERARGDSRIVGWSDVNWKLVRDGEDDSSPRWLTAYGRDVDQAETQVRLDPVTGHLTAAGGSRAAARRTAATEAVLRALQEAESPLNQTTIESAVVGVGRAAVRDAIAGLLVTGQIRLDEGAKNAKLYSLGDVPASLPVSADPAAHTTPASLPPPYKAAGSRQNGKALKPGESAVGLSDEQRAIIDRAGAAAGTDEEPA